MTLSATYISRKQLLVDNLVTQGVTGYTVDDGLTTLINAVLEIQGGGTKTLTLTTDKSILSYYDSDTATLSATLLEDGEPLINESIEFFNGSTSIGTATTNNNGVATKTYASAGDGDVSFTATFGTSLVSEACSIQDCLLYDETKSDKSSNYNTVNNTLTWSTDHYESVASCTSSADNYFAFTNPKTSLNLPRNITVELDIKQTGNLNGQWGISFTDSQGKSTSTKYVTCGGFAGTSNQKGIICNSPWGSQRTNGALGLNTWYHFKVTVSGTTVSFKITDTTSDTVIFNDSLTVSFMSSLTYLNVHQGQSSNTIQFKNLKIKP